MLVFLGNPGTKYDGTRHNVGWSVGDVIAERCGTPIRRLKNRALTARCTLGGREVLLVKPQTYMNLSGEAVQPAAAFYKVPPERVLVVSDDVSLPLGRLRIRASGSAGGHNGLKSIISRLGTEAFPRVKVGVGAPPNPDYDLADWVLSGFHGQDAEVIAETTERAADALESILSEGIDRAMSKFNG